jgi:hypothetical protein
MGIKLEYLTDLKDSKSKIVLEVADLEAAAQISADMNKDRNWQDNINFTVLNYEFKPGLNADIKLTELFWLQSKEYNPKGYDMYILGLEAGPISDEQFWKTIAKMEWSSDYSYKRINKEMLELKYGTIGFEIAIGNIFKEKKQDLKNMIDYNLEKNNLEYGSVIGLGDDSLDDLCSNIIGLGETTYLKAMKKVKFAGKQDTNESFAYIFHLSDYFK